METTAAIMQIEDYKQMIRSMKSFTYQLNSNLVYSKIRLEFDKETRICKAIACDGYALNVEEFECIMVQENFVVYVGAEVPIGEKCDYIHITQKELFGDEQFEDIDATGSVKTIDKVCTVSNPLKHNEITYIQTGYEEHRYFDYDKVIPKDENPFEIIFNPKLLIKALKAALLDKACQRVTLKFDTAKINGLDQGVIIASDNGSFERFKIVLPCRNPNDKKEEGKENGTQL